MDNSEFDQLQNDYRRDHEAGEIDAAEYRRLSSAESHVVVELEEERAV